MALLKISEVFGNDTSLSLDSKERKRAHCPFRQSACTKQGITDPLGTCSLSDGETATVICPVRFLQGGRLFSDAGLVAFGRGQRVIAVPEFKLLEIPATASQKKKKIGKVDFLLAQLDEHDRAVNFAALEVQSVYISGLTTRPAFKHYLRTGELSVEDRRRPDFRSSAQKRLMPQLALKVPIFRRWGKRFFVAIDSTLFATLPAMTETSVGNAEITWLVYTFAKQAQGGYVMLPPKILHTNWEDVVNALREGSPPEQSELMRWLSDQARWKAIHLT
ncbi:MAG TPA: NotI family restriction endonuclease [Acidisarcina sp.]